MRTIRWLFAIPLGLPFATYLAAQNSPLWRFWEVTDGLPESYTSSLASGAGGSICANHGDVNLITCLDGYSSRRIALPGRTGRIWAGAGDQLWTVERTGVRRFSGGKWTTFRVPEIAAAPSEYSVTLLPRERDRVLVLLPDALLRFDAATGKAQILREAAVGKLGKFVQIAGAREGGAWIAAERGLARWEQNGVWREYEAHGRGLHDFRKPVSGRAGEVLVAAASNRGGKRQVLRFDGIQWQSLYTSEKRDVGGWPGADGTVWIQEDNTVFRLANGRKELVESRSVLSGFLYDVLSETGGAFWVAGSQGIARYAPPLWRTPSEVANIGSVVHSITEDRQGRLWFACTDVLVCLHQGRWTSYPLPEGEASHYYHTDALCPLPDGRIAIEANRSQHLLVFDPERRTFSSITHPEGRGIRLLIPRKDGTYWVQTGERTNYRLEIYDGRRFRPYLDLGDRWGLADLRAIYESDSGDLWLGGTAALGLYRRGKYRLIGKQEGFPDTGAFYIHGFQGKIFFGGRDRLAVFDGKTWSSLGAGLDRARTIMHSRDGTLWVASGTGIHRYRDGIWITNSVEEGLPSSVAYEIYQDRQGGIWAGTTRGLSVYHPESDTVPPRTMITEEQNLRETPPGGEVRLVFNGIDKWKYTLPDRLLYSYRLDSGAWTPFSPKNFVSYGHLKVGSHRFEARAMDRNGNVDPSPASFQFTVLAPWYRNAGFLVLTVCTLLVIVGLVGLASIHYRHRGMLVWQLHAARLQEHDRKEILELVAGNEPLEGILVRIIRSLETHCVGALASILLLHDGILHVGAAPDLPEEFKEALEGLPAGPISGCSGAAAYWGKVSGVADIQADPRCDLDPHWKSFRERALRCGLRACWSMPVFSGSGQVLGTISLYYHEPGQPEITTLELLEALGRIAGIAMEHRQLYEQLTYQAQHDVLTGLPNRLLCDDRLQQALAAARRQQQRLALLYIDLDRFKQINDTLGHRLGDLFLRQVAHRLASGLRDEDTIARMGGDEFMVVMTKLEDEKQAAKVAERLLASLRDPFMVEGHELFGSASIGISLFPADGQDSAALQKSADSAMYRAKSLGKNRFEFFAREMSEAAAEAAEIEHDLRRALDQDQFELYYQPRVRLNGELVGLEALLRLHHPTLGLVHPGRFIRVAEETGLIGRIGEWVLSEVCRQIKAWRAAGYEPVRTAVNVSAVQFAHPDFADKVAHALREGDLDPYLLELELTESLVMSDLEGSARHMEKLRALGVSISVDDFGTGYSSLSYLHRLPIDVLKIDQSFVRDIDEPNSTMPVVQSIVALARGMGMTTVAEGVETERQRELLRGLGCDMAQGYLFARPVPAAAVEQFFARAEAGGELMPRAC